MAIMFDLKRLLKELSEIKTQPSKARLLALGSVLYGVLAVFIENISSVQYRWRFIFNLAIVSGGFLMAVLHRRIIRR